MAIRAAHGVCTQSFGAAVKTDGRRKRPPWRVSHQYQILEQANQERQQYREAYGSAAALILLITRQNHAFAPRIVQSAINQVGSRDESFPCPLRSEVDSFKISSVQASNHRKGESKPGLSSSYRARRSSS